MIDDTLTMIPGPTPVHRRILAALGRPTCAHAAPHFIDTFRRALADLRDLCRSAAVAVTHVDTSTGAAVAAAATAAFETQRKWSRP